MAMSLRLKKLKGPSPALYLKLLHELSTAALSRCPPNQHRTSSLGTKKKLLCRQQFRRPRSVGMTGCTAQEGHSVACSPHAAVSTDNPTALGQKLPTTVRRRRISKAGTD